MIFYVNFFICMLLVRDYELVLVVSKAIMGRTNLLPSLPFPLIIGLHVWFHPVSLALHCRLGWHFLELGVLSKPNPGGTVPTPNKCAAPLALEQKVWEKWPTFVQIQLVRFKPYRDAAHQATHVRLCVVIAHVSAFRRTSCTFRALGAVRRSAELIEALTKAG